MDKIAIFGVPRSGTTWLSQILDRARRFKNERVHGVGCAAGAEMTATSFEYLEVLQPEADALDARLQVTSAAPGGLGQRPAR